MSANVELDDVITEVFEEIDLDRFARAGIDHEVVLAELAPPAAAQLRQVLTVLWQDVTRPALHAWVRRRVLGREPDA